MWGGRFLGPKHPEGLMPLLSLNGLGGGGTSSVGSTPGPVTRMMEFSGDVSAILPEHRNSASST